MKFDGVFSLLLKSERIYDRSDSYFSPLLVIHRLTFAHALLNEHLNVGGDVAQCARAPNSNRKVASLMHNGHNVLLCTSEKHLTLPSQIAAMEVQRKLAIARLLTLGSFSELGI